MRNLVLAAVAAACFAGSANAAVLFSEDFSDNSAGWNLGPTWEIGSATVSSGGVLNPDPGVDNTPTNDNGVAGVVIGGLAPTDIHDYYWLTSPEVNALGQPDLTLSYYRWLNTDYVNYMHNSVQVYNGANWVEIFHGYTSDNYPQDTSWVAQSFDVSNLANANFRFRIGYSINQGGVYSISSWNVDDVMISSSAAEVPEPATLGLMGLGLLGLAARRRRKTA